MTTDLSPNVTIIGAGPAGLLLARYLQIHSIPCSIYEKEASATSRGQGGTLDLHEESGLLALKEVDLLDEARKEMRPEGEAMKLMDKSGKLWIDDKGSANNLIGSERPEIDRGKLRDILLASLKPDTIKWGHSTTSCRLIDNDTYEVSFEDQPSIITSLLVGADGTFSRVRPLVHSIKPHYAGISLYDMLIPASSMTPSIEAFVGQGMTIVLDDGKGFIPQMNSEGKCKVYAEFQCGEDWLRLNPLPEKAKKEHIRDLFQGWPEGVEECIMAADEESVVPRRIYAFDSDLTWDSDVSGVTVMGDAAHVMAPSGEGVNQALADALDLGRVLVPLFQAPPHRASLPPFPLSFLPVSPPPPSEPRLRSPDRVELKRALRKYEKRMMLRVRPEMRISEEMMKSWFGPEPAKNFKRLFMWFYIWAVWDMTIGEVVKGVKSFFI